MLRSVESDFVHERVNFAPFKVGHPAADIAELGKGFKPLKGMCQPRRWLSMRPQISKRRSPQPAGVWSRTLSSE
jgi:hypothetical protein